MSPDELPEQTESFSQLCEFAKAPKVKRDKCPECGGKVVIVSRSTPQVRVCNEGHGWFWWRGKQARTKPTISVESTA